MKKSRLFKGILTIVLLAFILQAGLFAYSMAFKQGSSGPGATGKGIIEKIKMLAANTLTKPVAVASADTGEAALQAEPETTGTAAAAQADASADNSETPAAPVITIPADVLDLIRQADPTGYDRNVAVYKELLQKLNVHKSFQDEMESMLKDGKKLSHILISYSYISDKFGMMGEVKSLAEAKTADKTWLSVFEGYDKDHPEFAPQSFEPAYLEELMKTDGITKDDIMIADRVSQKLSIPFKEVMEKRIGKRPWKDINAEYGIVNGQEELPHVSAVSETVKKLMQSSGLPEQSVIQAFVTAYKLDTVPEAVAGKMALGYSKTRIYAEFLANKYE